MLDNKPFTSENIPEGAIGFVYAIKNIATNKIYLGRKIFWTKKRKKVSGRTTRVIVESNWQEYYGSSAKMKADLLTYGPKGFIRSIIRVCYSKSEMAYFEAKAIFTEDALIKTEFLNDWITCRINARNLSKIPEYTKNAASPNQSPKV